MKTPRLWRGRMKRYRWWPSFPERKMRGRAAQALASRVIYQARFSKDFSFRGKMRGLENMLNSVCRHLSKSEIISWLTVYRVMMMGKKEGYNLVRSSRRSCCQDPESAGTESMDSITSRFFLSWWKV